MDLPGEAYIPRSYVPDMRLKIDLYRRLGRVTTAEELADFRRELLDRFGPPPPPAEQLLRLAESADCRAPLGDRVDPHRGSLRRIPLHRRAFDPPISRPKPGPAAGG